ncbi:MAG: MATE family efflux transporter [Pseudomonadota bacterium]
MSVHPPVDVRVPAGVTYREVVVLAYPVVFSMVAQTVMGLVDTLFMGWVSTAAQGAVGLGSIVVWSYSSFFLGTLTVINTFVAQYFGVAKSVVESGDPRGNELFHRCGESAWHGLLVAASFSCVLLAGVPLLGRVVSVFGPPKEVEKIAISYARIRIFGSSFRCFEMTITNFMRGIGDTQTPMRVALVAVLLNIPLNYWLIFGGLGVPPLGPDGAAWATVIATGIGVVALFLLFLRRKMREQYGTGWPARFELQQVRELLKVGLPIGTTWVLEMAIWALFTGLISRFGEESLAAHNIVLQVLHLSFMPGLAIGIAATTLVGQALGAQDPTVAHRRAYASIRIGIVFMALMGLVYLLLGKQIAGVFSSDSGVIQIAKSLFLWAAAFQVFDAMAMTSSGVLRGAGDTRWPMYASVLSAWLVFAPLIWLFGFKLQGGVFGAWGAAATYLGGLGVVLFMRVRRGKWQSMSVIGKTTVAPS